MIKYLLQKRLSEAIGDDGFAENQFGFRKKRSTLQALERVTYATETAIIRKRYCALITYDVRNAFNTLHWPDLFGELRRREVPRYLRRVLYTYFEGRKIAYQAEEAGIHVKYTGGGGGGVPQGSIIGPLLWLIYYDPILRLQMPSGCQLTGFVDDLGLTITAADLETLQAGAQEATRAIQTWLANHGLELSVHKTEWTMLTNKTVPEHFALTLNGVHLSPAQTVKYLGIYFEKRRKFRKHITTVTEKAIKMASAMSRLLTNLRGPRMFVRRTYRQILESILLYAVPIWEKASRDAQNAKKLHTVQKMGLSRVSCAYRSASLAALCVLGRQPPIHLKIAERTYIYETTHRIRHGITRAATVGPQNPEEYEQWKADQKQIAAEQLLVD